MVFDNFSESFSITNGAKQGWVSAPTLFGIVFALMLHYAFCDLDLGAYLQVRTDGGVFNLIRFLARTMTTETLICDLLFADDCAVSAHNLDDIQVIVDGLPTQQRNSDLRSALKQLK